MTEMEKRTRRVCFTGHRPKKLRRSEQDIKQDLEREIRYAVAKGRTVFLSGMARGVDIWAAEIILKLREAGMPLRLMCICPFPSFESSWSIQWQTRYRTVLAQADYLKYVCPTYTPACFQLRNEWMANHATQLIAVYNGTSGGTRNTLCYARQIGIDITLIDG